jgi:pimeloyl-ACP methyl ester carboxylesterase
VPYARNARDGTAVYFEDAGGDGVPVVFHGGLVDTVESVRRSAVAAGVQALAGEFRVVYADHRGVGRSGKPHDPAAYAMPLRVADAVAVLDDLGVARAHFVGASWGGRLGFGIGEHARDRVLSLVIGGQQPYAIDPDGPLARIVTESLAASRERRSLEPFVEALEASMGDRISDDLRAQWLANDPVAIDAAWRAALAEGDLCADLGAWDVPCLIHAAVGDADFYEGARRAAGEIPNAEFVPVEELDHVGAHLRSDPVLPAVLRMLREHSPDTFPG